LFSQEELETVFALRRILDSGNNAEINEVLINKLILTKNNKEFMQIVQKDIAGDRW